MGGNYKMSDINAAVGLAHLQYIDEEIELRTKAAKYYNEKIKDLNLRYGGIFIGNQVPDYCTRYNWQNYHILLDRQQYLRNDVLRLLKNEGIGCKWDIGSTHLEPVFCGKYNGSNLPNTDKFSSSGLWLPFFAEITKEEQDYVIDSLEEILKVFNSTI